MLAQQQRHASCVRPARPSRAAQARPAALLSGLSLPKLFGGSGGGGMGGKAQERQARKDELLELIEPLKRGLAASPEDQQRVEAAAQRLERLNPTPKPLESPLLNGQWRLVYTTSESILGTKKPAFLRPSGPIYQLLDGPNLRAANRETAPLYNQVSAELAPLSANKVAVQFKTFKLLGLIPVTAPPSARGELTITYLDDTMRVSRGDKGNLFVLLMDDADARP